jgi:hypothetical protein
MGIIPTIKNWNKISNFSIPLLLQPQKIPSNVKKNIFRPRQLKIPSKVYLPENQHADMNNIMLVHEVQRIRYLWFLHRVGIKNKATADRMIFVLLLSFKYYQFNE